MHYFSETFLFGLINFLKKINTLTFFCLNSFFCLLSLQGFLFLSAQSPGMGVVIDGISVIETRAIIAAMKEEKNKEEPKILQEESTTEEVVSCGHIITCGPSSVSGFKQRWKRGRNISEYGSRRARREEKFSGGPYYSSFSSRVLCPFLRRPERSTWSRTGPRTYCKDEPVSFP